MSERRPSNPRSVSDGSPSSRLSFLLLSFLLIALAWAGRLVYLQVIKADEFSSAAAASRTVSADISPRRGTIYDRNGNVLATSVDATTVYANPKEVVDRASTAQALADSLGGDASEYRDLLSQDTTFVYIKRKADVDVADALREKGLTGIYFIDDTKRVYPYGKVAGQVLGFVNVDGQGVSSCITTTSSKARLASWSCSAAARAFPFRAAPRSTSLRKTARIS